MLLLRLKHYTDYNSRESRHSRLISVFGGNGLTFGIMLAIYLLFINFIIMSRYVLSIPRFFKKDFYFVNFWGVKREL